MPDAQWPIILTLNSMYINATIIDTIVLQDPLKSSTCVCYSLHASVHVQLWGWILPDFMINTLFLPPTLA